MVSSTQSGNPGLVDAAVVDLNGIFRGKRLPMHMLEKATTGGLRMPQSLMGVDIWGCDLSSGEFVFGTGDRDGICTTTGRGPLHMTWRNTPDVLVPLWMQNENGSPFAADPRYGLQQVVDDFQRHGLTAVVATELEFYLVNPNDHSPTPPRSLLTGDPIAGDSILSLRELQQFAPFFDQVFDACDRWGIKAEAATSEAGGGQFEINIAHCANPLKAADDAMLFKFLVREVARSLGLAATFMAKPFAGQSGNGLHVHMSILDAAGKNIFDDGTEHGADPLRRAIAGLLAAMPASMLLFAPHLNSYRRFRPGAHAPTAAAWGYENRTTALRIPGGAAAARRVEHRVAGADANPYLVLSVVMAAALHGIKNQLTAPEPTAGNAYAADVPSLPMTWPAAVECFATSELLQSLLPTSLCEMLIATKRQEMDRWLDEISPLEYQSYLEVV